MYLTAPDALQHCNACCEPLPIGMFNASHLQPEDLEIVITDDGSHALRHKETGLFYRSKSGALTESRQVFFRGSRLSQTPDAWTIVELGLGGGVNFLLTVNQSEGRRVDYHAVDHSPVPPDVILESNNGAKLLKSVLVQCRKSNATTTMAEGSIRLTVHPRCWSKTTLSNHMADAFYFDPFAPAENPEAWGVDCFQWAAAICKQEAILATYAAQGQMRRHMRAAGFFVARGPGCGAKRESTLASKTAERLHPYPIKYKP